MAMGYFESELSRLRQELIQMGGAVEEMLDEALAALLSADVDRARKAIEADKAINAYETKVVDQTILLIATNQPVAGDLRFLAASLRLATELERIGDLSANLARRAVGLVRHDPLAPLPQDIRSMTELARAMLSGALDAFARKDSALAEQVLEKDDALDDLNRKVRKNMMEQIANNGPKVYWGLEVIHTAMHLERLGDHATNLAEEVIYINSGRNVRHCAPPTVGSGERSGLS